MDIDERLELEHGAWEAACSEHQEPCLADNAEWAQEDYDG